jgi:hypothetical protein
MSRSLGRKSSGESFHLQARACTVAVGGDSGTAAFDISRVRSKTAHEKQYDKDDQDNADDTNAAVTVAVTVAAEAATEATEQEDNE